MWGQSCRLRRRGSVGDVDLEIEFRDGVSLRRQLEDALRVAIRVRRLRRDRCCRQPVSGRSRLQRVPRVVVDSYAQLATEGYLSARRGSGTRVGRDGGVGTAACPAAAHSPNATGTSCGPAADFLAFPRAAWKAALLRALRSYPTAGSTYADHRGVPELRTPCPGTWPACAAWSWTRARGRLLRGLPGADRAVARAPQARRRRVAIEDPGWRWQRYTAEAARLEAIPIWVTPTAW